MVDTVNNRINGISIDPNTIDPRMKTIAFYSARVFGEERAEVLKKSGLFPVTYIEHWRRIVSPHKGKLTRYGPVQIKGQTVYRVGGGSIGFNEATRNRDGEPPRLVEFLKRSVHVDRRDGIVCGNDARSSLRIFFHRAECKTAECNSFSIACFENVRPDRKLARKSRSSPPDRGPLLQLKRPIKGKVSATRNQAKNNTRRNGWKLHPVENERIS